MSRILRQCVHGIIDCMFAGARSDTLLSQFPTVFLAIAHEMETIHTRIGLVLASDETLNDFCSILRRFKTEF